MYHYRNTPPADGRFPLRKPRGSAFARYCINVLVEAGCEPRRINACVGRTDTIIITWLIFPTMLSLSKDTSNIRPLSVMKTAGPCFLFLSHCPVCLDPSAYINVPLLCQSGRGGRRGGRARGGQEGGGQGMGWEGGGGETHLIFAIYV